VVGKKLQRTILTPKAKAEIRENSRKRSLAIANLTWMDDVLE